MSIQEKKNIVSLISTFLIFGCYSWFVFQKSPFGSLTQENTFQFWASFILILIPVTIAAKIIISILFSIIHHIVSKEKEPSFADEHDKLIELKATRNSHYVFMLGFILAMLSVVLKMQLDIMFIILVSAGLVSEIVGVLTGLYHYRKGV